MERKELTPEQLAYARSIILIERHLEPKCEGCGYGADRPNCAMGGGCGRHDQENVIAYHRTIDALKRMGGLNGRRDWRDVPLHLLHDFSADEQALLLDLHEKGGKQSTRSHDRRFDGLGCGQGGKGAILLSSKGDRWHVELTDSGQELIAHWIGDVVVSA